MLCWVKCGCRLRPAYLQNACSQPWAVSTIPEDGHYPDKHSWEGCQAHHRHLIWRRQCWRCVLWKRIVYSELAVWFDGSMRRVNQRNLWWLKEISSYYPAIKSLGLVGFKWIWENQTDSRLETTLSVMLTEISATVREGHEQVSKLSLQLHSETCTLLRCLRITKEMIQPYESICYSTVN